MKIVQRSSALLSYTQMTGMAIALLGLNAAPSRATPEGSKPTPDAVMVAAHAAAKGDGLLEALLTELDRSKAQLKMDQGRAPYYIEYRLTEVDDLPPKAAYHSLP